MTCLNFHAGPGLQPLQLGASLLGEHLQKTKEGYFHHSASLISAASQGPGQRKMSRHTGRSGRIAVGWEIQAEF